MIPQGQLADVIGAQNDQGGVVKSSVFCTAFDISSFRFPPDIVDVAAGEKFAVALASNGMVQPETLKP